MDSLMFNLFQKFEEIKPPKLKYDDPHFHRPLLQPVFMLGDFGEFNKSMYELDFKITIGENTYMLISGIITISGRYWIFVVKAVGDEYRIVVYDTTRIIKIRSASRITSTQEIHEQITGWKIL